MRKLHIAAIISVTALAVGGAWFGLQRVATAKQYDVVVVGAGPSGVAASLQAARMGAHVALLEPTDWVGGQLTTAAVGNIDEGSPADRKSGIFKEFVNAAVSLYHSQGKSVDTCYYAGDSLCIDPKVGQQILRQMLASQSNIQLYTDTQVTRVFKQGNTVTGVATVGGQRFDAKVVIDAGEYGDVIADAGAAYRLGNGTSSDPNANACVQQITYPAVIKKYPGGVPSKLVVKTPPPGYETAKIHFEKVVSKRGFNFFVTKHYPVNFASFVSYRGLPDFSNTQNYNSTMSQDGQDVTRTTINLPNDFPIGSDLSASFVSDPGRRKTDVCEAKLLTLDFIYYMQHDLGESDWSVADDEGYNTPYNTHQNHCTSFDGYTAVEADMPQAPYVREARRLLGTETLTSADLQRPKPGDASQTRFADSVAVGYYPMDLHGCDAPDTLEPTLDPPQNAARDANEQSTFNGNAGAFEVPEGVLIPVRIDGLLAAEKNISSSRLANGAVREQPIAMAVGQAAGALAALSVQEHKQPRAVDPNAVRSVLEQAGAVIDTPTSSKTL